MRSSRASKRSVSLLALLSMAIAGGVEVSAHRLDEYLQAARLAVGPDSVQVALDLTPGVAVAEAIIEDIDRNRDGSLSDDEQRAYGALVVSALTLELDGTPVRARFGAATFPALEVMRRGEGTIRIQSAAALPAVSMGAHQLLFRNRHDATRSVYLANALLPDTDDVAITAQRRDRDQTELTIEYILRAAPATSARAWLGGIAAVMMLSLLRTRRSRSADRSRRGSRLSAR